nr:PREDICTED: probable receptor-like protein kinase At5g15080 isoform X2 [Daucus carota subsp. sativus]
MTQDLVFLYGYTNITVNLAIILITILNIVVYMLQKLQEAEVVEQKNWLQSSSTRQSCYRFSFNEMKRATRNFHIELVIGKGGFGNVYKGTLGATLVAIKRLKSTSKQGSTEFRAEIEMLSKIRHINLVSLIGYCNEGYEMILVYEFMAGGTLADHIHKRLRQDDTSSSPLSWVQRLKICIGAARGLDYLHTGTGIYQRIIHRDVKSTNILLDQNFAAKVSDFGLSRTSPANQTHTFVSTQVKGTFGYFDPDYFQTQRLTRKSDVYAFGVVLFEVLCGRPAVDKSLDEEQIGLARWAQYCFREKRLGEIIDEGIKDNVYPDSLEMFVKVAIQCLQTEPKHRPTMAEVVVGLESALALQEKRTEKITSDENQEEIDISDSEVEEGDVSDHEVENENSDDELDGISSSRHQEKQSSSFFPEKEKQSSSFQRFATLLTLAARVISGPQKKSLKQPCSKLIMKPSNLKSYTFHHLRTATSKFDPGALWGNDDYYTYYKGTGPITTIKRLKDNPNFKEVWLKEIDTLRKLCHPNIVKLIGYCLEKERLLVLEHPLHGRLDQHLRVSTSQRLSWKLRIGLAHGAAKGLAYLHGPGVNVIHRDVKTSNILIDSKYNAKLSGFSLAKDGPEEERSHVTTRVQGTFGYIDPEYYHTGELTLKSDVYSFGVVLLELLTGRKADNEVNLASSVQSRLSKEHGILDIMDAHLEGQYTVGAASTASSLALRCTSVDTKSRPDAKQVAEELEQLLSLINLEPH